MIDKSFIIVNEYLDQNRDLIKYLFGDSKGVIDPPIEYVTDARDMYDLLVLAGIYASRTQAKQAWKNDKEIPDGISDFRIGKLHHRVTVWKPIKGGE